MGRQCPYLRRSHGRATRGHVCESKSYKLHLIPRVESIIDERLESNCPIIEKIPPKGESFSDFFATFVLSVWFDTYFDLQH